MQKDINYLISRTNKLHELGQWHIAKQLLDILNKNSYCDDIVEILSETADELIQVFDVISEEFYFQNIYDEYRQIPRLIQWS